MTKPISSRMTQPYKSALFRMPEPVIIRGRNFEISVSGWGQKDIDYFNECVKKLGDFYTTETILSRLNPFLKPSERKNAQVSVDDDYMKMFMQMFKGKIQPQDIIFIGQNVMQDNNVGLKNGAEKYLSTSDCKQYIENAAIIEAILKKIIREEEFIGEKNRELVKMKEEYNQETDTCNKKVIANRYNDAVDIYNNHVDIYNHLLKTDYEPLAIAQNQLAKEITKKHLMGCKDAFHKLLGKPPVIPKTDFCAKH